MPSLASSRETKAGDLSAAAPLFSSDPEFRFLLGCCALRAPGNIYERDGRRDLNWQRVLHLAEHHGVTPLIYRALRESAAGIPTAIQSELREFYDLDVLIRPVDFARASEALRSLNYVPNVQLSSSQQRACLHSGYECAFNGPLGKNLLEMQWAIVPRFFSVDFDVERFLERATLTEVGGHPVKTLCAEDLLLTLCVHAAKHGWVRLCWLRDIATVTQLSGLDWGRVLASAKDLGILRIVGVSLVLAVRLLQVSIPDSVLRLIQPMRRYRNSAIVSLPIFPSRRSTAPSRWSTSA